MLSLKNIVKCYGEGENEVRALKGISVDFRECEFVSILGQSGCGKTTLLNVIGGLNKATSGEIRLNGVSTDGFNDNDWDDYRNSKIGFVFQSYNLIPHLSILNNVELSLTISGVTGAERTARAERALERVGLKEKANRRPNELSGGQMQRVAIARAIVNEPDILLADEPTGAIDSETSVQIMEILKEISATKLVIMVTHNAELAEQYSTRIIRFKDGEIIDDTDPYTEEGKISSGETAEPQGKKKGRKKHKKGVTMSFFTAVKLSFKNLINKKGRSVLTAVAGSIGIISIALILALNNGFSVYLSDFERQSMSKYPIEVSTGESSVVSVFEEFLGGDALDGDSINISSMLDVFSGEDTDKQKFTEEEKIYIYGKFTQLFSAMNEKLTKTPEISKFKRHLEENFDHTLANVKYDYSVNMTIYGKEVKVDKETKEETVSYKLMSPLSESAAMAPLISMLVGSADEQMIAGVKTALDTFAFWDEIIADETTVNAQYEVLKGHLPQNKNEIVIVLDEYNQITDFDAFALNEMALGDLVAALISPDVLDKLDKTFDQIMGKEYYVLPSSAIYSYDEGTKLFQSVREKYGAVGPNEIIEEKAVPVKISGIIRAKEGVKGGCINGVIGYSAELGDYIISDANSCELAVKMKEEQDRYDKISQDFKAILAKKEADPEYEFTPEERITAAQFAAGMKNPFTGGMQATTEDYDNILKAANVRDEDEPTYIYFYPTRISNKSRITQFIEEFNVKQAAEEKTLEEEAEKNGTEKPDKTYVIEFEDNLDSVISELNTMVDTITYILVAVACVSVLVTMLLIAIIMYISVQDRTREIGIMRAIGARKTDISNIFNVETLLLGFASGVIGALIAFVLQFPANLIFSEVLGMAELIVMAWWHPLVLIVGSVIITVLSGLIPAAIAARKEPVNALRTE